MVILGIVGSPRRNGRTNRLVEAALEGAKSKGAEIQKIYLFIIQRFLIKSQNSTKISIYINL